MRCLGLGMRGIDQDASPIGDNAHAGVLSRPQLQIQGTSAVFDRRPFGGPVAAIVIRNGLSPSWRHGIGVKGFGTASRTSVADQAGPEHLAEATPRPSPIT